MPTMKPAALVQDSELDEQIQMRREFIAGCVGQLYASIAHDEMTTLQNRRMALSINQQTRAKCNYHHNYVHRVMFDQVMRERDIAKAEVATLSCDHLRFGTVDLPCSHELATNAKATLNELNQRIADLLAGRHALWTERDAARTELATLKRDSEEKMSLPWEERLERYYLSPIV